MRVRDRMVVFRRALNSGAKVRNTNTNEKRETSEIHKYKNPQIQHNTTTTQLQPQIPTNALYYTYKTP